VASHHEGMEILTHIVVAIEVEDMDLGVEREAELIKEEDNNTNDDEEALDTDNEDEEEQLDDETEGAFVVI
jgi:hypothetical protein